jgi:hypothetical protein
MKNEKMVRSILFLSLFLGGSICKAQHYDSARIYPLCMGSMFRVAIDQDLIKNEVDTVILINGMKATEIRSF